MNLFHLSGNPTPSAAQLRAWQELWSRLFLNSLDSTGTSTPAGNGAPAVSTRPHDPARVSG